MSTVSVDSSQSASAVTAMLDSGIHLYRPVLAAIWPVPIALNIRPTIIGSNMNPETVAFTPVTICRYVGRYASAPNMATPMTRPAVVASTKLRLLNSLSGMIGSAALCSAITNAAADTTAMTIRARMVGEFKSYSVPPQEVTRMTEVRATAMVRMPQTSSFTFASCFGSLRNAAAIAIAASPRGMLTQNAQRQPMLSVNQPPSRGPAM